jgi:hypothetical protein
MKKTLFAACVLILFSCASARINKSSNAMPSCLSSKIEIMKNDPSQGEPSSISQYSYKGKTVYYVASACCDKYNIVYDSACNLLGYPDGGYTGKGDGKMIDFFKEATGKKIVWKKMIEQ